MRSKKQNTYNIISKYPKGNKRNCEYTITYQLNNKPDYYTVKMIYLNLPNESKYVFLDLDRQPHIGIETKTDTDNFINEIKEYQKGSSYRKTHPILKSARDKLLEEELELKSQINKLQLRLDELTRTEKALYYETESDKLRKQINVKEVNKIVDTYNKLIETSNKYSIKLLGAKITLFDDKLKVPLLYIDNITKKLKTVSAQEAVEYHYKKI